MLNPRVKYADIPKRFTNADVCDLDNYTEMAVKSFLSAKGWRCLILGGNVGTGKTHAACAAAKAFCETACALYTTAYSMSRRIMDDKNADHFNKYPLLVIDEITRTFDTKAEQDRFFDLINYRYENEMPVILVGNFEIGKLKDILGAAVADRINENLTLHLIKGSSRRGV